MRRLVGFAVLALMVLVGLHASWADGVEFGPTNKQEKKEHHDFVNSNVWEIVAEPDAPKLKGKLKLSCFSDDKDEFRLELSGLEPGKVYTVWLTSSLKPTAERAGAGPKHDFKAGGGGGVLFQAPLTTCPLTAFKWVELRVHPDANATRFEDSVRVGKIRLLAN
ncbi:MAG: hypothetical protein FJX76_01035 [Armatimonadetes bacterium]|nr:hypothetical protein [Armatimonadota bacterium]